MGQEEFDFYQELQEQCEGDSDTYDDESASFELDSYDP
jgi:hypothetical protein